MLGDNIKKIMESKNISSKELASKAKITQTYLSYILNNKRKNPSMEVLNKIASILEVSVNLFFDPPIKPEDMKESCTYINQVGGIDDKESNETIIVKEPVAPSEYIEKYDVTSRDKKQYLEYIKKANEVFFMNDEIDEGDKKEILDTMTEIFWKAKAMNKRKNR